ncbi:MAG: T9SS type A sorting domain-containing protein [candidate division Zixibacteria bacterium]|nr:T9SS type A sorting domain-containing protein [candidate division Zixibacteria bacterium]MBU1469158.1 T9SS type A sorting domain-containing protein [candidate division Zixibacteria bacterium]
MGESIMQGLQITKHLTFMILVCLIAMPVHADVLTIKSKQVDQSESSIDEIDVHQFKSGVSKNNLLGLTRKSNMSLPDVALDANDVRTVRICAIRVQFQYEDVDDPATTGRGHFDFRSQAQFISEEAHEIDMAPHNTTYFETHLRALNEYWNVVSKGRVNLTYSVFPSQDDSVYTLNMPMASYSTSPPDEGLFRLFHEGFTLADADTEIDFSEYDAFVLFHAGADQQMDLSFSDTHTPSDLYTGFAVVPSQYQVIADNGAVTVSEVVLMPEAVSQDNRVVALNGVLAHEFGHQLGLVDLYDTRTFMTQVGDFSLMDNQGRGTAAEIYFGDAESFRFVLDVLPVFPDAWSRAYLGFVDVVEVSNINDIEVWAAEILTDEPQVIKVPISDFEYYLIENRQVDSDRDDSTNLRVEAETGVILGPAPASVEDPRYLTRDYDFFVPGSGILIWHIDETRAYYDYDLDGFSNFQDNALQWYNYYPCLVPNNLGLCIDSVQWENRRFVSLVEADGIIDFGGNYRTRFGSPFDFFFAGNNSALSPTTNPSSRSNSGSYTGIRIFNISEIDTIMTLDVRLDSRLDNFPQFVNWSGFPPVLADCDEDGIDEIFVSGKQYLIAVEADGSPVITPLPGEEIYDSNFVFYGDTLRGGGFVIEELRAIASVPADEEIVTAPLVAQLDDDPALEVSVGTDADRIYIWEIADEDDDGAADLQMAFDEAGGEVIAGPIVVPLGGEDIGIGFGTESGFYVYDVDGNLQSSLNDGPVTHFAIGMMEAYYVTSRTDVSTSKLMTMNHATIYDFGDVNVVGFTAADLDGSQETDFAAITADGKLIILLNGSSSGFDMDAVEVQVADSLAGGVVTAALDPRVPHYQILFAGNNKVFAYNFNGTQLENFPQVLDRHHSTGILESTPIVGDVDNDGAPEIIVGTAAGELFACKTDGRQAGDFPRFGGSWGALGSALIAGSSANNFAGMLFTVSADNRMYGAPVRSRPLVAEQSWLQGGRISTLYNFRQTSNYAPQSGSLSDVITTFYSYPNPASEFTNIRYRLSGPGNVKISMYDVSGRLVYEDDALGDNVPVDYRWNLDGYPSGVYICRLEANSGGSSEVRTKKIAVVR